MDNILFTLHQLRLESWTIRTQLWHQSFLTTPWWFIAIIIAISYFVWWKLVDKRRIIEILLFGSFLAVCRVIFDDWGISSGRWTYAIDLVPTGYSLFLNDLTVVPLFTMLAYQYSSNWKTFFAYIIVVHGLTWFVLAPTLSYLGILHLYAWAYYRSFLTMLAVAVVMRAIMLFGLKVQNESRIKHPEPSRYTLVPEPALKPLDTDKEDLE